MMKTLALICVTLMSLTVLARPGGPPGPGPGGPGPGFGPGPGGPGPGNGPGGPFPPWGNACDQIYDGQYSNRANVTFEFRAGPWGTEVNLYTNGQVWRARAQCDNGGFDFDVGGYRHTGNFDIRPPWGIVGLSGTEYWGGRQYQSFSARARR